MWLLHTGAPLPGFLSCDLDDKAGPSRFGVSTASSSGPLMRNVFQIVRPTGHGEKYKDRFFRATGEDTVLHYNEACHTGYWDGA